MNKDTKIPALEKLTIRLRKTDGKRKEENVGAVRRCSVRGRIINQEMGRGVAYRLKYRPSNCNKVIRIYNLDSLVLSHVNVLPREVGAASLLQSHLGTQIPSVSHFAAP